MVVSERTVRVISEQHNFNKGYPRWNLKLQKSKKIDFIVVLDNEFWSGKENDIPK